jgi:hypothetical protein
VAVYFIHFKAESEQEAVFFAVMPQNPGPAGQVLLKDKQDAEAREVLSMGKNMYMDVMAGRGTPEVTQFQLRPSWQYYWPWFVGSIGILSMTWTIGYLEVGFWVSAILLGIVSFLRSRRLFTVTSKRVIMREGLVAKNTIECEIRHSRELTVRQGVVGRILRYGHIEISTAASSGVEVVFTGVRDPHELKEAIRQLRDGI